jgi:hypothetical protein
MSAMAVVVDYLAALARHDVETMASLWAADGDEHIAGPGHADALTGDVRGQLERAAAA